MSTPQGESGASAIQRVQDYTNETTFPTAAQILRFLNKGIEEVCRLVGGPRLWQPYYTVTNQTSIVLNDDVQDIISANFSSSGSPLTQGALVYPMEPLEQASFMDAAAGFPAVGFGPPQAYFLYQDQGTNPTATLTVPPAPQLSVVTGTSNGVTVEAVLTYVNSAGETTKSATANIKPTTVQAAQVASPQSQSNATGYNVYAGVVGGPYYLQNASPVALGSTFNLPNPLLAVTQPPVTNTATGVGTGGALFMQLYPAAMTGQVNVYYRARPQLWADTTANSWTNLDTSAQEAAIIFATIRTLVNRQRAMEAKQIWQPEFTAMIDSLKESMNRRTTPRSGRVRDVMNRSFPSSPFWMNR